MTREIKNDCQHYYLNDAGQMHGEYKSYHENGRLRLHCHYNNDERHGEYKWYHDNGQLEYHTYDVNGGEVHNFIKDGDSEFIRVCLYIAHGAPWLGGSDVT